MSKELQREGLAKLRYILQNVDAGNLEHDQESWHCGTSHCIFGWVEVYEAAEKIPLSKLLELDIQQIASDRDAGNFIRCGTTRIRLEENIVSAWQRRYKIPTDYVTNEILERIWDGDAELPDQFEALRELEVRLLGESLKVDECPYKLVSEIPEKVRYDPNLLKTILDSYDPPEVEKVVIEEKIYLGV